MWTIVKNGKKSKPIAEANILDLIDAGKLSGSDLAWRDGLKDWMPLGSCPEFKSRFRSEKISIQPLNPPVDEAENLEVLESIPPEAASTSESPRKKKSDASAKVTLKHNSLRGGLLFVRAAWAFSLLGFLYFWMFFDPTVESEIGSSGRIMNLHASSMKSNGMLGCSVLLIISSLYIMTYHVLATLLRIERSLHMKEGA